MRAVHRAFLIFTLIVACLMSCGWGATGHKITAQVAYQHLTPKAKAEVDKLLEGSTLSEYSVWPDLIKGDPAWRWTAPWHYVNIPEGASGFDMVRDCPSEGCVVKGIERYAGVLNDKSATQEQKVQALKFLAHYVGDLHQPLHAGNKEDMLNSIYDPGSETPYLDPASITPAATPASTAKPAKLPQASAEGVKFVGSKKSEVYHFPGCADAKRIAPGNLVEYTDAPEGKRLHQGCPR